MRGARVSPCIGVCSTTYGDLVCRGCNRFAHEVVEWNGYAGDQRDVIWRRLDELRDGAVAGFLSDDQVAQLCAAAASVKLGEFTVTGDRSRAYEVLRRLALRRLPLPWREPRERASARELLMGIDREFHGRSLAVYERSFKVPAE